MDLKQAAGEFLACKRIAVTGVSAKNPNGHGGNTVYKRLRDRGYQVFAVNPTTAQVEGDPAYPDLASVPGGVEAVVIATRADRALATVQECAELGVKQVWMHRAMGPGSVSPEAADYGRQHGIRVISGGCPLMFEPVTDGGHRFLRVMGRLTGAVPRSVP